MNITELADHIAAGHRATSGRNRMRGSYSVAGLAARRTAGASAPDWHLHYARSTRLSGPRQLAVPSPVDGKLLMIAVC